MSQDYRPLGVGDSVTVLRATNKQPIGVSVIERVTRATTGECFVLDSRLSDGSHRRRAASMGVAG